MAIVVLNIGLALFASIAALLFGEAPEKRGAIVILAMILIAVLGHFSLKEEFHTVYMPSLIADLVALIGFGFIGVYTKRIWPLWAASLQLLSVGAHFVRALELPVKPIVYAWMKSGPTWAVILLLIGGTIASCLRRWSRTSAHSSPS